MRASSRRDGPPARPLDQRIGPAECLEPAQQRQRIGVTNHQPLTIDDRQR